MSYDKNLFTNIPIEFSIPKRYEIIFVSDFFISDLSGGAELTSEVLIKAIKKPVFKLHSSSITKEMVKNNRNKLWVFGNYTKIPDGLLEEFYLNEIRYYIIEYDFKYCKYRAPKAHKLATGKDCDCVGGVGSHGFEIETFCSYANKMFWMSERQKEHFLSKAVSLNSPRFNHVVQLSAFSDETFNLLNSLRKPDDKKKDKVAILSGGSWIKGIKETIQNLTVRGIAFEQIPQMDYQSFLQTLSTYKKFAFHPADFDTCPRVVIEAAILGCELDLNDNVLIKDDEWFKNKSPEEIIQYLKMKRDSFASHF